jgi:DNA polymerase epsilon subunit 3
MGDKSVPEFEPPQACVSRIIKNVLPDNIQVTKDARAAFSRAAGVFIFYLTHCANDFSKDTKRSTIYTSDVISALKEIEFTEFLEPLEAFLDGKRHSGKRIQDHISYFYIFTILSCLR